MLVRATCPVNAKKVRQAIPPPRGHDLGKGARKLHVAVGDPALAVKAADLSMEPFAQAMGPFLEGFLFLAEEGPAGQRAGVAGDTQPAFLIGASTGGQQGRSNRRRAACRQQCQLAHGGIEAMPRPIEAAAFPARSAGGAFAGDGSVRPMEDGPQGRQERLVGPAQGDQPD